MPDPCDFCKDKPVGNARAWFDGEAPKTAPCPRCGRRNDKPRCQYVSPRGYRCVEDANHQHPHSY